MSEYENAEWLISAVKLCLTVCAHDGLLSEAEEHEIARLFNEHFSLDFQVFDSILDSFFDSCELMENLVAELSDSKHIPLILKIAHEAAASDGLDVRENLALLKAKALLELNNA